MRVPLIFAAAAMLAAATIPANAETVAPQAGVHTDHSEAYSAAKKTKKSATSRSGYQAYGRGGRQIACTPFGCNPIPPGCRIRTGYNPWTWDPTGFDEVVCPYRR